MVTYEVAVGIAIGAVIAATIFRTFLPLFTKILAEIQLAQRENRDPVVPKIHWIWLAGAGINIMIVGFPMFATIDTFVKPIIDTTSILVAFFVVFGLANTSQEVIFRMMDSAVGPKDTANPQPAPATTTTETREAPTSKPT
jgi:hypothetical protein